MCVGASCVGWISFATLDMSRGPIPYEDRYNTVDYAQPGSESMYALSRMWKTLRL